MNIGNASVGRLWSRAAAFAVIAVVAFTGGVAGATIQDFMSPAAVDNPTALRGCVIRFDTLSTSGNSVVPRIHANSTHECVGVTSVRADWAAGTRGDLVVTNAGGPETVVTIMVSPDETMTARGITCGASGGGQTTRIRCFDRDGVQVEAQSLDMFGETANLWLGWVMWMDDTPVE